MRTGVLTAGLCILLGSAGSSSALTLTPLTDDRGTTTAVRRVEYDPEGAPIFSYVFGPSNPPAFGAPYDETSELLGLVATQRSSFSATGVTGEGSVAFGLLENTLGGASSTLRVQFALDEAALVSLTADLEYSASVLTPIGSGEYLSVVISFPDAAAPYLGSLRLDNGGSPDHDAASVSFAQILPAGTYSIYVGAEGLSTHAQADFATASWSFSLGATPVPESAGYAWVAIALLGLESVRAAARARVSPAQSCSRPASR